MINRMPFIALFVFVFHLPASGQTIFTPGDTIPADHVASTAIFRDFINGLDGPDVTGQVVRGLNSPEIVFQRSFDFAAPSNFRFDGTLTPLAAVPDILNGEPFLLGYLTYANGRFFVDKYSSEIFIQTFSPDVPGATQTVTDRVVVDITTNNDDPEQSADIVYFLDRPELGSLRVYEDEIGRIEVFASIGSLNLFSFGDVVSNPGSAFFFTNQDIVPEDFVPTDTGDGSLPPDSPVGVPEPSSLVLLLLAGVMASVAKRHR